MVDGKSMSPEQVKELNDFLKEFLTESDRGAALLGGAMLDNLLQQVLTQCFIEEKGIVKGLFDNAAGPLSTFSAKTKMAYCLGLISRDEYDNINNIRAIRNEFAHKIHGLAFDDKKIKAT